MPPTSKRRRYQIGIPQQSARNEFFNKKEIAKIRRYDFWLSQRTLLEQRAKAGDVDAYKILRELWHVRFPLLEDLLQKLGHWPE